MLSCKLVVLFSSLAASSFGIFTSFQQQVLTYELTSGERECFYYPMFKDAKATFIIKLLEGDSVSAEITSETGKSVFKDTQAKDIQFIHDVSVTGDLTLCLKKLQFRFATIRVSIAVLWYHPQVMEAASEEIKTLIGMHSNATSYLEGIGKNIAKSAEYMVLSSDLVRFDFYLFLANNRQVQTTSMLVCLTIIGTAASQVFFIRRLFRQTTKTSQRC